MSDADEIERIKQEKLERLLDQDGEAEGVGEADESPESGQSPTSPVHVEGSVHLADVVADHDLVLVDFYADWCGPCKQLAPVLEDLAAEREVTVAKVDVDEHQALAGQYQVRGVPTLVLFHDGEVVEQFTGARGRSHLDQLLDQYA